MTKSYNKQETDHGNRGSVCREMEAKTNGEQEWKNVVEVICADDMMTALKEKQRQLEESQRRLENEKKLLDALCIDYTSVHYCDLINDRIDTIKYGNHIDVEQMARNMTDNGSQPEFWCYTARIQYYFDNYIIQETAPDFLEKMSPEYLMKILEHQSRVIYRLRSKPNRSGQQRFEVHVVRLQEDDGFHVIMGYRYNDDVIEEQELHQTELETALEEARLNNEIISSISKIYENIYRMDLISGIYEEISAGKEVHRLTGKRGKISECLDEVRASIASTEYRARMQEFFDISTLPQRLKYDETISIEYQAANGWWYLARFIVKKRREDGLVTNVLFVIREINEQKKVELSYQKQLIETAEEAKRANMAKTDFLRRMSHDIRTPINGIRGMLEMSEYFPEDIERLRECRRKMWTSSEYLLNLVNSVLDMNKLESGKLMAQENPFDLMEVFEDLNNVIGTQAQEKGIFMLTCEHQVRHYHLIGSPLYVRQIFMNIGNNAVKYTESGGSIEISCIERLSNEEEALFCFTVKDSGIGMSPEFQKHIYESFAQEYTELDAAHSGVGLGMSICKQLVELLHGTIRFESKKGVGTTFFVELPMKIDRMYKEKQREEKKKEDISLLNKKLLLAEDNELNMEITKFILEHAGAVVDTAVNGEQAVQRYAESEPDTYALILMDIMMPKMNGYEAARKIRQMERADAKKIPIIAMSANVFLDDIAESRKAGMNHHLAKPIDGKRLLSTVRRYL